MRPGDRDLRNLGPWPLGTDNVSGEASLSPRALREGVNIVLDDAGKPSRREGFTQVHPGYEPTGLFGYGKRLFYSEAGMLMAANSFGGVLETPAPVYDGLLRDAPLAHCLIEPDIYVSDGEVALRVSPTNAVTRWSLPAPAIPAVTATVGGPLPAGRYGVGIAHRTMTGEEGPLSKPVWVELTDAGTLTIDLPAAAEGAAKLAIYLTKPNGTELMFFNSVVAAVPQTLTVHNVRLGRACETLHLSEMPAGRFATYYAGRLLVARADYLFWSEPLLYGLTDAAYNYTPFAEPITGLGTNGERSDGVFVGQQSRTYFIRGNDLSDAPLEEVYPSGMVPGTLANAPGSRLPLKDPPACSVPLWLTTDGVFCAGLPDGSVLPMTEQRYAAAVGEEGASVFVQQGGVGRLVVTTRNPADNAFAVSDSVAIEVVRNGISP